MMNALLPQLLSFPPHPAPKESYNEADYDSHIRKFLEGLSKIPAKKLTQDISEGEDLLGVATSCTIPSLLLIRKSGFRSFDQYSSLPSCFACTYQQPWQRKANIQFSLDQISAWHAVMDMHAILCSKFRPSADTLQWP